MARVKRKDHEKLSDENIDKVTALLEPEEGKPITKKEACELLNISYNTNRLSKIIETRKERKEYTKKRKAENRGKPAQEHEIKTIIEEQLAGEPISAIAKLLFRSPTFVKNVINTVGIPTRPSSAEERAKEYIIPDACVSEDFEEKEIAWSAKYHGIVEVQRELSLEYQDSMPGIKTVDYEAKYGCKCYTVYVLTGKSETEDVFTDGRMGGYYADHLAYELASLRQLKQYGAKLVNV